jgi:predicted SprT family Zn-dependent metalloprotease
MYTADTVTTIKTPTDESYSELSSAYRFFNAKLFENTLPSCLLTLHRKKSAYGYFCAGRFEGVNGALTDEIALNPDTFKGRPDRNTLSTLVHEMVHLWQQHFGEPSRSGYHNKEWATKMEEVGLIPSTTGSEGGARTGQRCSHYIATGAAFDRACDELLKTGFAISWKSAPMLSLIKSGKRTKYTCQSCKNSVWGKEGISVNCGDCREEMEAA